MESTKGLYVGQSVAVTLVDEQSARAFTGIVLDVAATGASATVAQDTRCQEFLDKHRAGYIEAIRKHDAECEKGKEIGIRVKAASLHVFTAQASQLIVKFRETAARREAATKELEGIARQISESAPKQEKSEKKTKAAAKA